MIYGRRSWRSLHDAGDRYFGFLSPEHQTQGPVLVLTDGAIDNRLNPSFLIEDVITLILPNSCITILAGNLHSWCVKNSEDTTMRTKLLSWLWQLSRTHLINFLPGQIDQKRISACSGSITDVRKLSNLDVFLSCYDSLFTTCLWWILAECTVHMAWISV